MKLINLNSPSRSAHARIRTKGFTLSPAFLITGRATQFPTSSQARKSHFEKPNSASQQWHLQIYSRINEWVFERTNERMNGESYIYAWNGHEELTKKLQEYLKQTLNVLFSICLLCFLVCFLFFCFFWFCFLLFFLGGGGVNTNLFLLSKEKMDEFRTTVLNYSKI